MLIMGKKGFSRDGIILVAEESMGWAPVEPGRGRRVRGKERILLVDDDADFLFSASVVLRSEEYRVSIAESGENALALVIEAVERRDPFVLLITDMQMPGMSGLRLIDALRKINISLMILAMTGFGDHKLRGELCARGCSDQIDKPFEPKDFVKRVRKILDSVEFQRLGD